MCAIVKNYKQPGGRLNMTTVFKNLSFYQWVDTLSNPWVWDDLVTCLGQKTVAKVSAVLRLQLLLSLFWNISAIERQPSPDYCTTKSKGMGEKQLQDVVGSPLNHAT